MQYLSKNYIDTKRQYIPIMHGCYNAFMIYGFVENDQCDILCELWLDKYYREIGIFALDVVKNCLCRACYGVICNVNPDTGAFTIDDSEKNVVAKLFEKYVDYHGDIDVNLGFHLVVCGDYDTSQHEVYVLGEESSEECSESDEDSGCNDNDNECDENTECDDDNNNSTTNSDQDE